ncbi:MAG: hypothetical protein KKA07_17390, partial [Bacteroidetes bacterium]|nr:hypothetical protein [Bacteroidota bacterium]MBU1720844.1 hypothetical protein [Bacteroidota bacterium]
MRTKRNFSFFILHFSFLLLAFLLMGTSCKKDRKTWYTSTFKGVAVDYFDGTPIAGLRVALVKKYKIREMYPDIPVYEFDTLEV